MSWYDTGAEWDALKKLSGGDKIIEDAFGAGQSLGDLWFAPGIMGRVRQDMSPEEGELLSRYRGESWVGGKRSGEGQQSMDYLADLARTAGTRSAETQDLIRRRTEALQGLSQPELMARKENSMADMNRGLQTALRSIRSRFPGAAGAASSKAAQPAIAEYGNAQRGLANDLIQTDAALKREALGSLEGLVRGVERDEFSMKADARNSYADRLLGREQWETADRADRLDRYANYFNNLKTDLLNREVFNLGQKRDELGGRVGTVMSSGSFGAGRSAFKESMDLAREQLEAMKEMGVPMPMEIPEEEGEGEFGSAGFFSTDPRLKYPIYQGSTISSLWNPAMTADQRKSSNSDGNNSNFNDRWQWRY
jgi:hypothetical protein